MTLASWIEASLACKSIRDSASLMLAGGKIFFASITPPSPVASVAAIIATRVIDRFGLQELIERAGDLEIGRQPLEDEARWLRHDRPATRLS